MQNQQLELAYKFVQFTNTNVFLTGKAGTGKTTFLHNLKKSSLKRMAVVAPTGVAAINAGGVTIHSFFQLPFGPYAPDAKAGAERQKKFNKEKINLIQSLDLLVIDEISMVRADTLDGIDEVLRRYKNRNLPFGGVQLLMIGDLHQLSPVVKDDDWRILREYYDTLFFFGSRALQKTRHVDIELKHIYRQSDESFISLLNSVRENKLSHEVLSILNQRHIPDFKPTDEEGYITLTTHNNTAHQINESKLAEIKSPTHRFHAEVSGEFPEYSYPTVTELELKVDAQVMFVKNDSSKEKLFYNGKIGKVVRIEKDSIFVKCPSDHMEIEVKPTEWQNIKYELNSDKEVEEKVIGSFIQHPLKLAWAITIHKSQGLTFEKAIIDANAAFAHGQVYVALSRCKSFEGMVLSTPIAFNSVKTDGTISQYTKTAEQNAPDEKRLTESRIAFQQALLFEIFDYTDVRSRFFQCVKVAEDNDRALPASLMEELNAIRAVAEKDVYAVAESFKKHLNQMLAGNKLPEENDELQERIKKASGYFVPKLEALLESAQKLNTDSDNKNAQKSITEAIRNFRKEVFVKISSMKLCADGFSTSAYLRTKANAEIDFENTRPTSPVSLESSKKVAHPKLYNQLRNWRNALATENNIPVYIVLPQKALNELVEILPATLEELETIKGIGKAKVKQYGKEILAIIGAYCEENSIVRNPMDIAFREEKVKVDTKRISLEMFRSGKTVEQIAADRGLVQTTIEGHIAHFVGTGEVELSQLVPEERSGKAIEYIRKTKPSSIADIKIAFGDEYSYAELRAILNHVQFTETSINPA
ncbi:MAG: family ATPase [Sphingobacteriaceae bacterium]|jgi:hypothetical protein|nr:family ATPase [Sphingobacteriaceae bacterium]